jgi:hypothetical protein
MRIPAVAIAAAFVGGILLGLSTALARHAAQREVLAAVACCVFVTLLLGLILVSRDCLRLAGKMSLASWVGLGIFASGIAQQPLPIDHILRRIAAREVDLKIPQRWYGRLTGELLRLP